MLPFKLLIFSTTKTLLIYPFIASKASCEIVLASLIISSWEYFFSAGSKDASELLEFSLLFRAWLLSESCLADLYFVKESPFLFPFANWVMVT